MKLCYLCFIFLFAIMACKSEEQKTLEQLAVLQNEFSQCNVQYEDDLKQNGMAKANQRRLACYQDVAQKIFALDYADNRAVMQENFASFIQQTRNVYVNLYNYNVVCFAENRSFCGTITLDLELRATADFIETYVFKLLRYTEMNLK